MDLGHTFLFVPNTWVGDGTITLTGANETLKFFAKWHVNSATHEGIVADQVVKMEGADAPNYNHFRFFDFAEKTFQVSLENASVLQVMGYGIKDKKTIAWEFRGKIDFQGYEVYEKEDNANYRFHAEYAGPDQFRTVIDGRIKMNNDKPGRRAP